MEKRTLSIDKCTKEKCERCDFGYILMNFVKPIMQCLTNDIKTYYMRLLTTKCLNSAVMIAYFMLGNRGIKMADHCDTHLVRSRHSDKKETNTGLLEELQRKILNTHSKYRQLYYILITDAEFPHPDGVNRNFPGHVFIIEKIPESPTPVYYFHQSYINKYDYLGHIKRNKGSLQLSWDQVKRMIEQIRYVILSPTWDELSVKYWKQITFVDTKGLLGAQSGGKMFLCFKDKRVVECVGRLEKYVDKKLKQISQLKISKMNEIYGDESSYDRDQKPLTNLQVKTELENLQRTIQKTKVAKI